MRGEAAQISSTLATPRAVSRMAWTSSGSRQAGLGLELGEQAVDVVDVLGALDLGDHDHVERLAGLESPPRSGRRDPTASRGCSPASRAGSSPMLDRLGRSRPGRRGPRPCRSPARRPRGWRAARRRCRRCRAPWPRIFGFEAGKKWIIRDSAGPGSRAAGAGAPTASGLKKSLGDRTDHDLTTARLDEKTRPVASPLPGDGSGALSRRRRCRQAALSSRKPMWSVVVDRVAGRVDARTRRHPSLRRSCRRGPSRPRSSTSASRCR